MSFSGADPLDVILRLSNLQEFVAGTHEAASSVREIGHASAEASTESEAAAKRVGGAVGLIRTAAVGAVAAVGAIAWEGIKMATEFQSQMELIHTQAGASQKEVDTLSSTILTMTKAGSFSQTPTQLAAGIYHIESVGLRGKKALDALKVASEGAAVGQSDLESTSSALSSAWLAQVKGTGSLRNTMALLNAAVGAGNMRMTDMVEALGQGVLPAAKLAGVGIKDVLGAIATLSDLGIKGSKAANQLAVSYHYLYDPTAKAAKQIKALGIGQDELAQKMRHGGLLLALEDLHDHMVTLSPSQQATALGNIFPAARGREIEILLQNLDRYRGKVKQVGRTSKDFSDDVKKTQDTSAYQVKVALSQIQSYLISFGQAFMPVEVILAKSTAFLFKELSKIGPILKAAFEWVKQNRKWLEAVAIAIGLIAIAVGIYVVVTTIAAAVTAAWASGLIIVLAIALPVIALVIAIVAAFVYLYMNVKEFRTVVNTVFKWVWTYIKDVVNALIYIFHQFIHAVTVIIQGIVQVFKGVWEVIKGIFTLNGKEIMKGLADIFRGGVKILQGILLYLELPFKFILRVVERFGTQVWHALKNTFIGIVNTLIGLINDVIRAIDKIHVTIPGWVPGIGGDRFGFNIGTIGLLSTGGGAPAAAPGFVQNPSRLLSNAPGGRRAAVAVPAGKMPDIHVHVHIDRREAARAVGKYTSDRQARK